MKIQVSILSLIIFMQWIGVKCADRSKRLQLKIQKHQPCTKSGGTNEKIRFPTNEEAPVQADPAHGDGCYTITGTVNVLQPITGTIQLYMVTKFGTNAQAEKCQGHDENNCGGIGSCIYCDVCKGIKELSTSQVRLTIGNNQMDCKKGLTARNYSNIRISFCMPTKQDFLKKRRIDEDFWNRYGRTGQSLFATIYIFNKPVNTLSRSDLENISKPNNENVIGCHKFIGKIYESDS